MYLIPYAKVEVPLLGQNISTPLLFGVMGAASNFATGAITQNVLPQITSNPMVLNNSMVVEPVVSGLANCALASVVAPGLMKASDIGMGKLFLTGAGAEIAGNYGSQYLHGMGYGM